MTDETKLKFIVTAFDLIELNAQRAADLVSMLSQKYDCGALLLQADDYVQKTHDLGLSLEELMNRILDEEDTQEMPPIDMSEAG
jgi:hypothetical protein